MTGRERQQQIERMRGEDFLPTTSWSLIEKEMRERGLSVWWEAWMTAMGSTAAAYTAHGYQEVVAERDALAARLSELQDTLAEYVRLHEQHGRHAFPSTPQTLTDPLLDEARAALALNADGEATDGG